MTSRALGLVVELVAEARVGPPLDAGAPSSTAEAADRDEAVVLAVEDERRDAEPAGASARTRACSREAPRRRTAPCSPCASAGRGGLRRRPPGRATGSRRRCRWGSASVGTTDRGRRHRAASSRAASSPGRATARTARSGFGRVGQQVAGDDEAAERVAVQHDRPARRRHGRPRAAPPGRRGAATSARRRRADRRSRRCRAGRRPRRRARPRPAGRRRARSGRSARRARGRAARSPTARRPRRQPGVVGGPVPDEQVRAVGARSRGCDRWHGAAYATGDRRRWLRCRAWVSTDGWVEIGDRVLRAPLRVLRPEHRR